MVKKERIKEIKKEIEKEFPSDFALQQVHIARKLLSEEAKEKKMSFLEYVKIQARDAENAVHDV